MDEHLPPTPISPVFPLVPTQSNRHTARQTSHDDPQAGVRGGNYPISRIERPFFEQDPTMIPLPPSPSKPRLASRRPVNWVSSTSLPATDPGVDASRSSSKSHGARRISARLPSGPAPLIVRGRTISGAMQHAMRPVSTALPTCVMTGEDEAVPDVYESLGRPVVDPSAHQTDDSRIDRLPTRAPEQGTLPDIDIAADESEDENSIIEFGMDEIRSSVLGMTDQQDDEIWMQYVRDQLSTLFPDFFDPTRQDISAPRNGLERHEEVRGWEMVREGDHRWPTSDVAHIRGGEVPNVRDEIGGLREEIERLRGVVGGFAESLYQGSEIVGSGEKDDRAVERLPADYGNGSSDVGNGDLGSEVNDAPGIGRYVSRENPSLPEIFYQNAPAIAELVRAVSRAVNQIDAAERPDEEVFSISGIETLGHEILFRLSGAGGSRL